MDLFRTLGPSYGKVCRSRGRDLRLELDQKVHRKLSLRGRIYMKGVDELLEEEGVCFRDRMGFRLQGDLAPSKRAKLRARFETVFASETGDSTVDRGSMLYWEVAVEPSGWTNVRARISVFETDSWDARLYQHESDLPGVMRNVAVSGVGSMGYLLCTARPVDWFKLCGKVSWRRRDGETQLKLGLQTDVEIERF